MKKPTLIVLITLFFHTSTFAGISIISDLDDTIKITNSGNIFEAFFYGTAKRKVYLGVPEFLAASRDYVSEVSVVTASPKFLKYNVKRLIKKHDLQFENLILNRNINRPSRFDFKLNAIKKIIDESSDQFILIGDDVGEDPEIYDEVMKFYPDRILASYIHVIENRKLPETSISYWTTFELAVREYEANRLDAQRVESIINIFKSEDDFESVFPEFAHCPRNKAPFRWLLNGEFSKDAFKIVRKIQKFCLFVWDD